MLKRVKRPLAVGIVGLNLGLGTVGAAWAAEPVPATMQFAKVKHKFLAGDRIGKIAGGMFCFGNGELRVGERTGALFNLQATVAFKREMEAAGFKRFQSEESAFDSAPSSDPDYRLGGTVESANYDLCNNSGSEKGTLNVVVKWEIFSVKQQRVVLTQTTTGDYRADTFQDVSGQEFESRGFASALKALFSSAEVQALMAGNAPAPVVSAEPPLRFKTGPVLAGDTQKNSAALLNAVATIASGQGTGSGFYVADGYLLTNRHVVGAAKYVKVKLANGKELVGEVVRENAARDVALLKTETTPFNPLHLKPGDVKTGAEVYAIGSPLGQKLAGTLTKGVISGTRDTDGASYLQSDVAINPGNSGGPLLDNAGNVVGIATAKIQGAEGLAFFIPIKDALDKLTLELEDTPSKP